MFDQLKPLLVFFTALFASYILLPKLINMAKCIGLVDQPGGRKIHKKEKPLVGGVAIAIVLALTSLFYIPFTEISGFFTGFILMAITGFLDDFKELSPKRKLFYQTCACLIIISTSNIKLHYFGDLIGAGPLDASPAWLIPVITIFAIVGVINSINMIDGIDGLVGGVSYTAFIAFAILASFNGDQTIMLLCVALAGAVFGFLRYNWHPAKIFMGDTGSLAIGFSLAYLAITLTQRANSAISPVAVLLILTVPITDTLTLMIKRLLNKKNPFTADRYHLHHIFLRYGLNTKNVAKTIIGISFLINIIAILGVTRNWPDYVLFSFFSIYFIIYFTLSFFLTKIFRIIQKIRRKRSCSNNILYIPLLKIIIFFTNQFALFRKDKRYATSLHALCIDQVYSQKNSCTIYNISKNGCALTTNNLNFLRKQLQIQITMPASPQDIILTLKGQGVWFEALDNGSYLHGIRFTDITHEQREILARYIQSIARGNQGKVLKKNDGYHGEYLHHSKDKIPASHI